MRIVTIIGARPQFVKAAPLSRELRREHEEVLVHTGQHYDQNMSDVFFRELQIPPPDRHLGIGSGPHGAQTGGMLAAIEQVLLDVKPDVTLVYGDTNSTLAGALAAAKLHVPVAHVEAGLRSFNRRMPEEINRVLTDHLSVWLFAPSQVAVRQLAAEGVTGGVYDVGDIMADCVREFAPVAAERSDVLKRLGRRPRQYAAATVHRAENTDDPRRIAAIFGALQASPFPVVLPLHPRTRAAAARLGMRHLLEPASGRSNVTLVDPLGYLDMLQLQQNAAVILTDSGGMQKEAYYLGVPCVTMRDETEWTETVELGWNRLAGADRDAILAALRASADHPRGDRPPVYGDAYTAGRIVGHLAAGAAGQGR